MKPQPSPYAQTFYTLEPFCEFPSERWFEVSHNYPQQKERGEPGIPSRESLARRALFVVDLGEHPTQHAQHFVTHFIHPGKPLPTFHIQETLFWLKLLFYTEPLPPHTFEQHISQIYEESILTSRPPVMATLRAQLEDWLARYTTRNQPSSSSKGLAAFAFLINQLHSTHDTLQLLLDIAPPQLLTGGLSSLSTVYSEQEEKQEISALVVRHIPNQTPLELHYTHEQLMRLSPSLECIQLSLNKLLHHNHNPARILTYVQDHTLYQTLIATPINAKLLQPEHIIAHIYHQGPHRLEHYVERITSQLNTWDLMSWGIIFKVHSIELAPLMLKIAYQEKRAEDFSHKASHWLHKNATKTITYCLNSLYNQSDTTLATAQQTILQRFIHMGYAQLVKDIWNTLKQAEASTTLDAVVGIKIPSSSTHTTQLPNTKLPPWLQRQSKRGFIAHYPPQFNTLDDALGLQQHAATLPALYTQAHPDQHISPTAIRGILRALYKIRKQYQSPTHDKIRRLLTRDSLNTLVDYLDHIWMAFSHTQKYRWLKHVTVPYLSEDKIKACCARYASILPHERRYIYKSHDIDLDILWRSQHPLAIRAILKVNPPQRNTRNKTTYLPAIVTKLARELGYISPIILLELYLPEVGTPYKQRLYFESDSGALISATELKRSDSRRAALKADEERLTTLFSSYLPTVQREQQRWTHPLWMATMEHPFIFQMHRSILWHITTKDDQHFQARCMEDLTLYTIEDEPVDPQLLLNCSITIAIPEHIPPAERVQWANLFAEDHIITFCQEL